MKSEATPLVGVEVHISLTDHDTETYLLLLQYGAKKAP